MVFDNYSKLTIKFRKLRNKKAIYLLFLANAISGIAQGIAMAAVTIYFTDVVCKQSLWSYALSLVMFLGLFWRLYAGALVDGFKRKDVFLGTNFFAGLIVFAVAGLGYAIENGVASGHLYRDQAEYAKLKEIYKNGEGNFEGKQTELGFDYNTGFTLVNKKTKEKKEYKAVGLKVTKGKSGKEVVVGHQLPTVLPILVFATTLFVYFIHFPNLFAFIQEIEDAKSYSKLTRWIEVIGQVTAMTAGFATAILMQGNFFDFHFEPWKIHDVFLLNGIAYAIAFVIIIFMKYEVSDEHVERMKANADAKEAVTVGESLKLGYLYLKKNPVVFYFSLLCSAIFVAYMTMLWAPIQIYITNHLDVVEGQEKKIIGYTEFFLGGGALVCAIFIKYLFDEMPIPKVIIILTLLITGCFITLAFVNNEYVLYTIAILIGFANAGSRIYRVLYLFGEVPNRLIGRVQSILTIPQTLIPILFLIVFGMETFVTGHNVVYMFMILGGFTLVNAILVFFVYNKVQRT